MNPKIVAGLGEEIGQIEAGIFHSLCLTSISKKLIYVGSG